MIEYCIVPRKRGREAYQWHRGFAAHNDFILPRPWHEYKSFADEGQLWCARTDSGDFLGLAYYAYDARAWELGGLMVASSKRSVGLGSTLARLVLGHLLYNEDPTSRGEIVMTRIHVDNAEVIPLAEKVLGFRKKPGTVQREWSGKTPESPAVIKTGYEFHLVKPDTLLMLADWCDESEDTFGEGKPARILFSQRRQTLRHWAVAFREMAAR
jgi:hypothetical protein